MIKKWWWWYDFLFIFFLSAHFPCTFPLLCSQLSTIPISIFLSHWLPPSDAESWERKKSCDPLCVYRLQLGSMFLAHLSLSLPDWLQPLKWRNHLRCNGDDDGDSSLSLSSFKTDSMHLLLPLRAWWWCMWCVWWWCLPSLSAYVEKNRVDSRTTDRHNKTTGGGIREKNWVKWSPSSHHSVNHN